MSYATVVSTYYQLKKLLDEAAVQEKRRNDNNPDDGKGKFKISPISFISGIAAGLADTAGNYPVYGLHYRKQRGINIWQWKYFTPRELYRGVIPYSAIIPVTCIMDGMTDFLKGNGVAPAFASFISGGIAAILISTPTTNLIVTDQRLSEAGEPAGLRNSIKEIVKYNGYAGFRTGMQWLIVREGIYSWSVFYAKDATKKHLQCNDGVASIISGTFATIISHPFDTLSTYMQGQKIRKYSVICIKEMLKERGLARFYKIGRAHV